jgi:siroheme synthase (precorrin-2 oxidase/ferrochelatase)
MTDKKKQEDERKRREFLEKFARGLEATEGKELSDLEFRQKMRELNDKKPLK